MGTLQSWVKSSEASPSIGDGDYARRKADNSKARSLVTSHGILGTGQAKGGGLAVPSCLF